MGPWDRESGLSFSYLGSCPDIGSCAGTSRGLLHLYMLCTRSERLVRVYQISGAPSGHTFFQISSMPSPFCRHTCSQGKSPSARVGIIEVHSISRNTLQHLTRPALAPLCHSRHRTRGTYRKCLSVSAQQSQTTLYKAEQTQGVYTVSLRTDQARKAIRFSQAKDGRIVIDAVAIGSEAQEVRSSEALGHACPCGSTTLCPVPC